MAVAVGSFVFGDVRYSLWTMPRGQTLFQRRSLVNGELLCQKVYRAGQEDVAAADFEHIKSDLTGCPSTEELVDGAVIDEIATQYEVF